MDFRKFFSLIMIEQTLFALPFAFLGVLFAGGGTLPDWILVAIALMAARTAGMSFNRVIDREIDAKNPRTSERLLPKGLILPGTVWLVGALSSLALIVVSFLLNNLCFYLSFLAVGMLLTYSYFKRFSSSSHFYLGLVEAAAPIGGYLAVKGEFNIVPFILGFAIMAWIAGLDIVYALQDMEFDLKEKLHSIPARLGKQNAITISAMCYLLSIGSLVIAGDVTYRSLSYWIAVFIISCIFFYQQLLARRPDFTETMKKIFKINMFVSPILLAGTFIDVFWLRLFF